MPLQSQPDCVFQIKTNFKNSKNSHKIMLPSQVKFFIKKKELWDFKKLGFS